MPSVIDVHPSTERLHALDALRGMPAATSSATRPPASIAMTEQRNAGLDALRAAIVLLVVFHHTAITYGANGLWYYREVMPDGSPGSKLLTLMCSVDQAFFMGLLFLLAGYFLPGSLARHGALGYVKERLVRLGIPILVFGFVIGLATIALGLTAKGIPFTTTLLARWSYGTFAVGPLWFAVALLIFTAGFLAWRSLARPPGSEADTPQPCSFPSNAMLAIAALAIGAAAFALRLAWPVGNDARAGSATRLFRKLCGVVRGRLYRRARPMAEPCSISPAALVDDCGYHCHSRFRSADLGGVDRWHGCLHGNGVGQSSRRLERVRGHLCALGAAGGLGCHPGVGPPVRAKVRRPGPGLVGAGAALLCDLCHPSAGGGRGRARLARCFGATPSEIHDRRRAGDAGLLLDRRAAVAHSRYQPSLMTCPRSDLP
jgi:hypothetical protein